MDVSRPLLWERGSVFQGLPDLMAPLRQPILPSALWDEGYGETFGTPGSLQFTNRGHPDFCQEKLAQSLLLSTDTSQRASC